ncbi:MAG: thiamine phosphate synthase [Bacillota bacterium]
MSINRILDANVNRGAEGIRVLEDIARKKFYHPFFPKTDIYGITGETLAKGKNSVELALEMADAGMEIIQYREKDKTKDEKLQQCLEIRKLTRDKGITFIVNDDLDIALAVKADGIHVGQDDLPVEEVRRLAPHMIVGVSTHNPEQAIEAVKKGADYIGVGPIFPTTTKKNVEASEGLHYLKWVSENISLPYVAIGGITVSNLLQVKQYGGSCVAMISEIVASENIKEKVMEIREILNKNQIREGILPKEGEE